MTGPVVVELLVAEDVQGYCDAATGECVPGAEPVGDAADQETRA